MKKDFLVIGGLFLLIIVLLIVGNYLNIFLGNLAPQAILTTKVDFDNLEITAEVAKTKESQNNGLSKRERLAAGAGMLFVFDKVERYSFWMKDVNFALDMIWIDQDKLIADITHNAQPEPGIPDDLLRIYKSSQPILYVLEVLAGTARSNNLKIGDKVEFEI